MARCVLFCLIGIGLTVGLNINGPHWKARLSDAKIRSPLMAFINYPSQGNGNNELFTRQEVDELKRLVGSHTGLQEERKILTNRVTKLQEEMKILTNGVTKLEREFKEIKEENKILTNGVTKLKREFKEIKEESRVTIQKSQEVIQETKECLKDLQNDIQETNERLVIVERLLGISQRENQPNKFFEGLAIKCAKWAK
jgi:uncharacterized protein (DUF3084 family)